MARRRGLSGGILQQEENPDLLGFQSAQSFSPKSDLERLEVAAANEVVPNRIGLQRQVSALSDIEGRKGEEEAVIRARGEAGAAVDRDAAQFERATRGFDLSDRQRGAVQSRIGLTRALAQAERAGSTRRGFTDRAKAVRRASGGFADLLFGQHLIAAYGQSSGINARCISRTESNSNLIRKAIHLRKLPHSVSLVPRTRLRPLETHSLFQHCLINVRTHTYIRSALGFSI